MEGRQRTHKRRKTRKSSRAAKVWCQRVWCVVPRDAASHRHSGTLLLPAPKAAVLAHGGARVLKAKSCQVQQRQLGAAQPRPLAQYVVRVAERAKNSGLAAGTWAPATRLAPGRRCGAISAFAAPSHCPLRTRMALPCKRMALPASSRLVHKSLGAPHRSFRISSIMVGFSVKKFCSLTSSVMSSCNMSWVRPGRICACPPCICPPCDGMPMCMHPGI